MTSKIVKNKEPLLVIIDSNPPSMSEFLAIKSLLTTNKTIIIGIKGNMNGVMDINKVIEMWILAFNGIEGIDILIIPNNHMTDAYFIDKLKKNFKRIAVKDKLEWVYYSTRGYEMVNLPYVPGYEPLFLAQAYRQSIAYRYLQKYVR